MNKTFFITGGSGFIGMNMVNFLNKKGKIIVVDKVNPISSHTMRLKNVRFYKVDINDEKKIFNLLKKYNPNYLINFAAETHVDRSIDNPKIFIKNNINGLLSLLINVKKYNRLKKIKIKFVQISTDEVYGDVKSGKFSSEKDNLIPSSPYSATKASADLIINSFIRTYKLHAIILRLCNNYGPYQNPEKLIPRIILKIINNKNIPIYGKGNNKREWIFVNDTCKLIYKSLSKCKIGEIYNIGSKNIKSNNQLVKILLKIFKDDLKFKKNKSKIEYVKDRPGHDYRYSLNTNKIEKLIKFKKINLEEGLLKTCGWYLNNNKWLKKLNNKYEKRVGIIK